MSLCRHNNVYTTYLTKTVDKICWMGPHDLEKMQAKLKSVELLQDGVGAKETTVDRVNQVINF